MDTAGSFLLLLIFAIIVFGFPLFLLVFRLVEMISEWRESLKRAEDESAAEESPEVEKKALDDAGEWTPAKHMR